MNSAEKQAWLAQQQTIMEKRHSNGSGERKWICPYSVCLHKQKRVAGYSCFALGCTPAQKVDW